MTQDPYDDTVAIIRTMLTLEAVAMGDAALCGEMDEARFRADLIARSAIAENLPDVAEAALDVVVLLGTTGSLPQPGYGDAVLRLARVLRPFCGEARTAL